LAINLTLAGGCHSTGTLPPICKASTADLDRYAGDWFLIEKYPDLMLDSAPNRPDQLTDLDSVTGQAVAPQEALDAMRENVENGMPTSELAEIVF
jgi:hypothetical protein